MHVKPTGGLGARTTSRRSRQAGRGSGNGRASEARCAAGQNARAKSRHIVTFKEKFKENPTVSVSISMWDMDHKTNSRADITAVSLFQAAMQVPGR
ncbi:MAG: hypothetical protein HC781_11010 [Leptolyngbyaceae cyanobacterium CSU_1_4]|nr:hypothetical protein [Leptolyngbyaceae cyanobacterium CSU_1_4]